MDAWLNTNVDGLILMLIVGLLGIFVLAAAAVVQYFVEPRAARGEFEHQAAVGRAKQEIAANTDPLLAAELAARREFAMGLYRDAR